MKRQPIGGGSEAGHYILNNPRRPSTAFDGKNTPTLRRCSRKNLTSGHCILLHGCLMDAICLLLVRIFRPVHIVPKRSR